MYFVRISFFSLLFSLFSPAVFALHEPDLLPVDEAFKVTATANSAQEVLVSWQIAEGYLLYQNKFKLQSQTAGVKLGKFNFPTGKTKHDEVFGEVIVYRNAVALPVPLLNPNQQSAVKLSVKYQGCADMGVCYPPQNKVLEVALPVAPALKTIATQAKANPLEQLTGGLSSLKAKLFTDELLPAEQAFQFFAQVKDANTLHLNWLLADGYYLYREKIKLTVKSGDVTVGNYEIPHGTAKHDESFGDVEIFHQELNFDVPLLRQNAAAQTITLEVGYQGCADRGVCYPPMTKQVNLDLPVAQNMQGLAEESPAISNTSQPETKLSEQDQIVTSLKQDSLWLTLLTFLGFGLLLSLTPCVFPMVPILSGIIVGQGKNISTGKAFGLSLSYVIATALTYTVFGVLAALFGSNLQAAFQQPWVIGLFSAIFVALSLSMFGFYHLEIPKGLRAKLHHSSDKHRDGSYLSAFIMGGLSALIVGPCVAAPLAGALIYIGQTGDVVLGGAALFMLGFGMGVPLLIIGASAGKLLPKSGHWLEIINPVFGVIMLAVALWMLDRILPAHLMMLLWAMLLMIPAIYLKAIDPLPHPTTGWRKLWKGLGLMMLVYGLCLLIGFALGNTNPLQPLQTVIAECNAAIEECKIMLTPDKKKSGLSFQKIQTASELDHYLQQASDNKQLVMLDFYADWCISCKEMEAYTFSDPKVQQRLANVLLLQLDMTDNTEEHKALLKRFNLIGPPAALFFGTNKQELPQYRVIGYQDSATFLAGLQTMGAN
jgi:thioredoxin:protein disulfide reductase